MLDVRTVVYKAFWEETGLEAAVSPENCKLLPVTLESLTDLRNRQDKMKAVWDAADAESLKATKAALMDTVNALGLGESELVNTRQSVCKRGLGWADFGCVRLSTSPWV